MQVVEENELAWALFASAALSGLASSVHPAVTSPGAEKIAKSAAELADALTVELEERRAPCETTDQE